MWLFDPARAAEVSGWGLLASVVGTAVTVLAFGITICQLARARSAAKKVENAVNKLRSRVATYDLVFELSKLGSSLRETQRHISNESWSDAVSSNTESRVSLVRLSELPSSLSDPQKSRLSVLADQVEKINRQFRSTAIKGTPVANNLKLIQIVADIEIEITRLIIKVEKSL